MALPLLNYFLSPRHMKSHFFFHCCFPHSPLLPSSACALFFELSNTPFFSPFTSQIILHTSILFSLLPRDGGLIRYANRQAAGQILVAAGLAKFPDVGSHGGIRLGLG